MIGDLWRQARPLLLADALLGYLLGAGMARYLGNTLPFDRLVYGLLWLWMVQLAAHWLYARLGERTDALQALSPEARLRLDAPLWGAYTALTLAAVFSIVLLQSGTLTTAPVLVMLGLLALAVATALPPWRLADSPYRSLLPSLALAGLTPVWGFVLHAATPWPLVGIVSLALAMLHFAIMLVFEFPAYAEDLRYERKRLLVRLGWERAMRWIGWLILGAFLVLAFALLSGLPQRVGLPAFLVLPLGLLLIFELQRIAAGAPPHWRRLKWLAALTYALTAYLLAFGFWMN